MRKSHVSPMILVWMLVISMLSSCGMPPEQSEEAEKIIVDEFGYVTPSMSTQMADVNNLEAVTELSSHIIKCTVKSLDDIAYTDIGLLNFRYSVEVNEILMDVSHTLEIGGRIPVASSEGLIKAADAADRIRDTPRAKKLGILQGEYQENEYIRSSTWEAIPIEAGKTYIMFLTDRYLADEGVYSESGRSFLYEIAGQSVLSGREMTVRDESTDELVRELTAQIELRTGRADEVGNVPYMMELGERQARTDENEDETDEIS